MAIVHKSVPPINPTDPEKNWMYIVSNIFFCYANVRPAHSTLQALSLSARLAFSSLLSLMSLSSAPFAASSALSSPLLSAAFMAPLLPPPAARVPTRSQDVRDQFSAAGGDAAAYKAANNDLNAVCMISRGDFAELRTILTAIVDYRG